MYREHRGSVPGAAGSIFNANLSRLSGAKQRKRTLRGYCMLVGIGPSLKATFLKPVSFPSPPQFEALIKRLRRNSPTDFGDAGRTVGGAKWEVALKPSSFHHNSSN